MKEEIFISSLVILVLFNVFVVMVNPTQVSILNQNITGIIVTGLTVAVAAGIQVFGSGLSDSATKMIFAIILIFNVLFQVNIYGFTLGLGLMNTVFTVFNSGDVLGFGTLIGGILSFITIFSGMLIVVESG